MVEIVSRGHDRPSIVCSYPGMGVSSSSTRTVQFVSLLVFVCVEDFIWN